jgi:hypothetical protein
MPGFTTLTGCYGLFLWSRCIRLNRGNLPVKNKQFSNKQFSNNFQTNKQKKIFMENTSLFIQLAKYITLNGGLTYNALAGTYPNTGYAVAQISCTEKVLNFNTLKLSGIARHIAKFTVSHPELYFSKNGNVYLGAWVHDNILHIEVTKVFKTAKSAILDAQINKQHSYYDLKNDTCIELKYL